jgi:methylmalonyl-CoA carboxyltransferase 5S subunit
LGPGHNPTESLVAMLEGTGYKAHLDKACLHRIKEHFAVLRPRYAESFMSNIIGVETDIFDSQIPGGMISNMESQLKQQRAPLTAWKKCLSKCRVCVKMPVSRHW